ncbi:MAG: M20/M25/M40 family metallo-hydrolase [Armatimonadetes bacterium]|nr:M20/M25/M40 family metallo-hydrolase [Armatimonadota bacterium]
MNQAETALIEAVAEDRDRIVDLCRNLCRINTVNPYAGDANACGEKPGQEFLAPILEGLGARVTLFDCPDDIYPRMGVLGPAERNFRDRPNLVAEFDFGGPGPTVIINGHMDTVGVDSMSIDPLAAEVREGRIWGRGTSDCKGGITTAVSALRCLAESGVNLRGRVIFESVVDEECNGSGAGTLACLDAGYVGDVAVFVDGNDDALTLGCSGCLTADLHVEGLEGHAAYGTGVSAIEKALTVKAAIDEFKRDRETARPDARVNLGIFRAGVHPAVVPGSAYLSLNCVYEVDEAAQALERTGVWGAEPIRKSFEALVRAAESADPWLAEHPSRITWVKDLIPFSGPEDMPLAARVETAYSAVTGRLPARRHMLGWSDASYYSALGRIPTVLYGPGVTGKPHSPDEYVEIDNLVRCTQVLALFLLRELD